MTLTKVTFEYSNGSSKYITGKELEQWNRFNTLVASLAANHGMNPDWDRIRWVQTPTKDEEVVNFQAYKQQDEHKKED